MTTADAQEDVLTDDVLECRMKSERGKYGPVFRGWVQSRTGDKLGHAYFFTNSYGSDHSYLLFLADEAKRVTPGLRNKEIQHGVINDASHRGHHLVTWRCERPEGYSLSPQIPTYN